MSIRVREVGSRIFNEGSQTKPGVVMGKQRGKVSRDDPIYLQAEINYVVSGEEFIRKKEKS